jgi:Tub family
VPAKAADAGKFAAVDDNAKPGSPTIPAISALSHSVLRQLTSSQSHGCATRDSADGGLSPQSSIASTAVHMQSVDGVAACASAWSGSAASASSRRDADVKAAQAYTAAAQAYVARAAAASRGTSGINAEAFAVEAGALHMPVLCTALIAVVQPSSVQSGAQSCGRGVPPGTLLCCHVVCACAAPPQRIRCHIRRSKQALKGDKFQLFVESAAGPRDAHPVLSARRRKKATAPHFVIALSGAHGHADGLKARSSSKIIASVLGNRQGTAYRCLASSHAAADLAAAAPGMLLPTSPEQLRLDGGGVEIAAVRFRQAPVGKVGGVRAFLAVVPDPAPPPAAARAPSARPGPLLKRQERAEERGSAAREGLFVARSVPPAYVAAKKMYVMDFQKRVTKGSPKNCQLAAQDQPDSAASPESLFLFGKNDQDLYAMDFAAPLSLLQAFAIAVACFDTRSFST